VQHTRGVFVNIALQVRAGCLLRLHCTAGVLLSGLLMCCLDVLTTLPLPL
jgi:hypothetical protein